MRGIPILVLAVLLAGCADPTSLRQSDIVGEPLDVERGSDEFWFVHVTGRETQNPPSLMACSIAWQHSVDLDARTIRFNDAEHSQNHVGSKPGTLFATAVWDASSCPMDYRVTDAEHVTISSNALGDIQISVRGDGSVAIDGQVVQPGQSIVVSGSGRGETGQGSTEFTLELTVQAVGLWPHAALVPTDGP